MCTLISGYYSGEEEAGEDCPLVKAQPVPSADCPLVKGRHCVPTSSCRDGKAKGRQSQLFKEEEGGEEEEEGMVTTMHLLNITQLDQITFADE